MQNLISSLVGDVSVLEDPDAQVLVERLHRQHQALCETITRMTEFMRSRLASNQCFEDLVTSNVMLRGTTLVIVDPVAS